MWAVSHRTVRRVACLEKRGLRPEEKEVRRIIRRKKENCLSCKGDRRNGRMKPKVIHTKTFSCANDHPIVFYAFNEKNEAVCEYCYDKFVYEPEDPMQKEKELLEMSMKESIRQKEERTPSEKMQDKLEPIDDYVNKVLKGSG